MQSMPHPNTSERSGRSDAGALWQPAQHNPESGSTAWSKLHALRVAESTKPFLARGHRVKRCTRCLLNPCFCAQRTSAPCEGSDFLLVFHRNELLKPTNTGRLIADCFPANTWACTWHRTQQPPELLTLINQPQYAPVLVFPGEHNPVIDHLSSLPSNKRLLLIALDGTWKQARKIYLQSPWLHALPIVHLQVDTSSQYQLRQAPGSNQLATVEAVSQTLALLQNTQTATALERYFTAFTQHYLAMRSNHSTHN